MTIIFTEEDIKAMMLAHVWKLTNPDEFQHSPSGDQIRAPRCAELFCEEGKSGAFRIVAKVTIE